MKLWANLVSTLVAVLLHETLDSTFRIHQLLFTGKKGMAVRADLNTDIFFGRPRVNFVATGASNGRF
jgi:hypothetical protein